MSERDPVKVVQRQLDALRLIADQPLRAEMHAGRRKAAMINDQSGWVAYEGLIHKAREALYERPDDTGDADAGDGASADAVR
jgi:hypothetical protein